VQFRGITVLSEIGEVSLAKYIASTVQLRRPQTIRQDAQKCSLSAHVVRSCIASAAIPLAFQRTNEFKQDAHVRVCGECRIEQLFSSGMRLSAHSRIQAAGALTVQHKEDRA